MDDQSAEKQDSTNDKPRTEHPIHVTNRGERKKIATVQISVSQIEHDAEQYRYQRDTLFLPPHSKREDKGSIRIVDHPQGYKNYRYRVILTVPDEKEEGNREKRRKLHENPTGRAPDDGPESGSREFTVRGRNFQKRNEGDDGESNPRVGQVSVELQGSGLFLVEHQIVVVEFEIHLFLFDQLVGVYSFFLDQIISVYCFFLDQIIGVHSLFLDQIIGVRNLIVI